MIERRSVAALAVVLFAAAATAQRPSPKTYDEALARYRQCIGRLPFTHHTEGREALAAMGSPDALKVLLEDYRSPKIEPEYTRYTLAAMFGQHFDNDDCVGMLKALRLEQQKPVDTWLWVNALEVEARRFTAEEPLRLVAEGKATWQKAAAIAALGYSHYASVFDAIQVACAAFPKKDRLADRYLILGAMSGAIFDNRSKARLPGSRAGMTAYINLLAPEVDLPHTAKVQMARHLQWTLDGPGLMIDTASWLRLLEQPEKKASRGNTTTGQPRFFGIETEGERFCYVVDMSDSMCKELDPEVIPRGPVTGPRKKKPKGELPTEEDLPWHLIHNRFQLAKEHLKLSLQRLPDDKYFSIVWFGDEAGTLPSCPGLIKATKANVARVIQDLDAIVPGPADATKALDGTLRGATNMHAGLRQAFSLSGKSFVADVAYVDPGPLTEGCDTIFLLSDGAPSWDEFHKLDKDYGEGQVVVDTEYNKGVDKRPPMINYHGPYDRAEGLVEDVRRMNAFRRVRLHCIAIGEANVHLLEQLAAMGHGEIYTVGRAPVKKPGADGK